MSLEIPPEGQTQRRRWAWPITLAVGVLIAIVVGVLLLVRAMSLQSFTAAGEGMAPTIRAEERFVVNRSAYRGRIPQRGDIVVHGDPQSAGRPTDACSGEAFVHRVIGLPGETVEVRSGDVIIEGSPLSEPYADTSADRTDFGPTRIPDDAVFVMGDNRPNSRDSRVVGPVPLTLVCGKVVDEEG